MAASSVSAQCALSIALARHWLALRRATTASSPSQRAADFAEARRITATAVVLQRRVVAAMDDIDEPRR